MTATLKVLVTVSAVPHHRYQHHGARKSATWSVRLLPTERCRRTLWRWRLMMFMWVDPLVKWELLWNYTLNLDTEIWTATHISVIFFILVFCYCLLLLLFHPFERKHPKHINVLAGKYGHIYISVLWNVRSINIENLGWFISLLPSLFQKLRQSLQKNASIRQSMCLDITSVCLRASSSFMTFISLPQLLYWLFLLAAALLLDPCAFFALLMYGLGLYTSKQNKIVCSFLFL